MHLNNVKPPLALFVWLNSQVLLTTSHTDDIPRMSPQWRAVLPTKKSSAYLSLELLGFTSPAEAECIFPGANAESSREFEVPNQFWTNNESFLPFLRTALGWGLPPAEKYLLAERLYLIREATRRPVPPVRFAGRPLLCVDFIALAGESLVYFKGWWRNGHGAPLRLTAESPEGERYELLNTLCRFSRKDIEPLYSGDLYTGFTSCIQLKQTSLLRTGWVIEIEMEDGFIVEAPAPPVQESAEQILSIVLPDIQIARLPHSFDPAEHVHHFISQFQTQRLANFSIEQEVQFGSPVSEPLVSIIIPLYGRVDLIEHQLAQFAIDPTWAKCDLIYILDSPEHWERVAWHSDWLSRLYKISLRLLRCNQSGGYAAVNNRAAERAKADLVLFLNSDVLPMAPGWIEKMAASYRKRPGLGALGPKLLFEDNSIQHAGMGFTTTSDPFGWETLPYFKGLHENLPEANRSRPVPAVTGACLMVDKALFHQVNGFDQNYIQGDFEDIDLCMRLSAAGHENWYDPEIALYHLEGVSYPLAMRLRHAAYNRWLHSRKWSTVIQKLIAVT